MAGLAPARLVLCPAHMQKARPCERTGLRSCYHLTSRRAHALRLSEYPSILRQISVPPAKPTCSLSAMLLRDVCSLLSCLRLSPPGSSLSAFRQRYFFPSSRSLYYGYSLYPLHPGLSRRFSFIAGLISPASMTHSHNSLQNHTFHAKFYSNSLW